jgi:hypothetical protein
VRPRSIRVLAASVLALASCGREHMLPRPEPLEVHRDTALEAGAQKRLADIRRFLPPEQQAVLERSLTDLARDPRLPQDEVLAALDRALSRRGAPEDFCERLTGELRPLRLSGPPAAVPPVAALVASIDSAYAEWLSKAGRRRYGDARELARAIRDQALAPDALDAEHRLGAAEGLVFVTDGAEFERPGPSAARRVCLVGPPTPSYVVAFFATAELDAELRVPTAADGVCRPDFTLAPGDATPGVTCSGRPEFVTAPLRLGDASELRLSR